MIRELSTLFIAHWTLHFSHTLNKLQMQSGVCIYYEVQVTESA